MWCGNGGSVRLYHGLPSPSIASPYRTDTALTFVGPFLLRLGKCATAGKSQGRHESRKALASNHLTAHAPGPRLPHVTAPSANTSALVDWCRVWSCRYGATRWGTDGRSAAGSIRQATAALGAGRSARSVRRGGGLLGVPLWALRLRGPGEPAIARAAGCAGGSAVGSRQPQTHRILHRKSPVRKSNHGDSNRSASDGLRQGLLSASMLRLTRWMADHYLCPLGQVLEAVVPSGVRGWAGTREQVYLRVPTSITARLTQLKLPVQAGAVLADAGHVAPGDDAGRFGAGGDVARRLRSRPYGASNWLWKKCVACIRALASNSR